MSNRKLLLALAVIGGVILLRNQRRKARGQLRDEVVTDIKPVPDADKAKLLQLQSVK